MSNFNARASRSKRPCPLWVDAFQRDTQHLAADEVGAYMLILMAMWTRESCDFPDDDGRLARVSRISVRLWKSRIGPVLREFFGVENGSLISKRLREEAAYTERQVQQQSDRKSAEKSDKPLKDNNETSSADGSTDGPWNHPTQQPNNPTLEEIGKPISCPFSDFWDRWPNKVSKASAEKAWRKLRPFERDEAFAAITPWFSAWRAQNPQASPIHAATYLNQKRWQDQPTLQIFNGGKNDQRDRPPPIDRRNFADL